MRHSGYGWKVSIIPKNILSRRLISFLECGVDDNVHDMYKTILLHSASYQGNAGNGENAARPWRQIGCEEPLGRDDITCGLNEEDRTYNVEFALQKLLLERGMDVNARRNDHETPLHVASYFGRLEIVRLLLDHGADANVETKQGLKLLHQVFTWPVWIQRRWCTRCRATPGARRRGKFTRRGSLDAITSRISLWEARDRASASRTTAQK
jgi:hypothetical protein